MSAWQTKTCGSTGSVPILVMLLTAWGLKCSCLMAHAAGLPSHVQSPVTHYSQGFLGLTLCLERKKAGMQERKFRSQRDHVFRWEILAGSSRSVENADCEHGSSPNIRQRPANDTQLLPEMQQTHTLLQSLKAGDKTDWICLVYKLPLTYFLNLRKMWLAKELKKKLKNKSQSLRVECTLASMTCAFVGQQNQSRMALKQRRRQI